MTDSPHLRPARPDDAESIAAIWYEGWRDAHLGNVPDELIAVRPQESFEPRATQRIAEMVGRDDVRAGSVPETVTLREEVRPMNAVSMWVLPVFFTVGRLM